MTRADLSERAPYAHPIDVASTRDHNEQPDALRTPFPLDRHRIIGCTAFRRLEGKTQVFAPSHHDHFRTRLTHTLEASHLARTLAKALRANEDLAEAITLAHDLGHPPFGHAGEKALTEVMAEAGEFNHNLHALRVVEYLEHPFPAFRGLNLTAATRAGLSSHTTSYDTPEEKNASRAPSVEAQISSLADRIAYNSHDLEDAIGAKFVSPHELSTLSLWKNACDQTGMSANTDQIHAIRRPVLDAMLSAILSNAVDTSSPKLAELESFEDVETATTPLVTISETMNSSLEEIEQFLADRVYRHADVASGDAEGKAKILALFNEFRRDPGKLPKRFATRIADQGQDRVIGDYIAGMTDRYCEIEFKKHAKA